MGRRAAATCAIIAAGTAICLYYARFALIDDAYISFRYARNLLEGHGLVFNPGERVEGYTNFLWVMLLAGARVLGVGFETASRVLGAGCGLLTVAVLADLAPRADRRPPWSVLLAPALFVAGLVPLMWAVHGLETALFTLLLALAFRADIRGLAEGRIRPASAVWLGLASLTRPEGTALFVARLAWGLLFEGAPYRRRGVWLHLGTYAAIFGPSWSGASSTTDTRFPTPSMPRWGSHPPWPSVACSTWGVSSSRGARCCSWPSCPRRVPRCASGTWPTPSGCSPRGSG